MRLLRHSALVSVLLLLIVGCVGGGAGGGGSSPDEQTQSLVSITGAFVDDMPVARAVITVIDAQGVSREAITDDNGLYYMEVNDLTLPLLVVGTYTQAGVVHTQYAFVSADKATADSVTANINEYTTLLVAAMAQEAGVALDTAPETLDDTTRNLILGVDYLSTIASMEELFCSVLLNPDGTPLGCEWGASEDLLSTPYAPTIDGNAIDKLVALMDITVDLTTGDVIVADSTGVTIATVSLADIIAGTIPTDTLTPTDAANLEAVYTPPATITPIENEDVVAQVSTDGRVRGYVDYYSNALTADIMIENLSSCPGERRNLVVTPGVNAATPSLIFPDYDTFDVLDRSIGNIGPIDACRPYAFDYQFDYNLVIRKTQTGLVDGVPVWTYDVPACEQYSNKTLEKILQETYQDTSASFATSFSQPYIEVRPALHRYNSEPWPPAGMSFVYDLSCPMIADFSMTPTEGTPSLTVTVDASNSVGNLVSYEWLATGYQTSISATGPTTSFTFDAAGTYTIELTVTDTNGQTDVLSKTVVVDSLPQASFTSTLGSASNQIKLNAVNSTGTAISYSWTANDAIDGKTKTGQNVDFTFAAPGGYTVTLVVTDQYGNVSTLSKVVTVEEITALAVDDTFILSGELEFLQSTEYEPYTIDVLANDVGNIGDIVSIDNAPANASLMIAADKKSIILSLAFYPVMGASSTASDYTPVDYSFTYTAENLDSGGTITGTVTVDINPTYITRIYAYSTTWYKSTAEVTTGISSIYGYKVVMANGAVSKYQIKDDSVLVPVDWGLSAIYRYSNGVLNGTTELYEAQYPSPGTREFSTCATTVKTYTDGTLSSLSYYRSSFTTNPCAFESSYTY